MGIFSRKSSKVVNSKPSSDDDKARKVLGSAFKEALKRAALDINLAATGFRDSPQNEELTNTIKDILSSNAAQLSILSEKQRHGVLLDILKEQLTESLEGGLSKENKKYFKEEANRLLTIVTKLSSSEDLKKDFMEQVVEKTLEEAKEKEVDKKISKYPTKGPFLASRQKRFAKKLNKSTPENTPETEIERAIYNTEKSVIEGVKNRIVAKQLEIRNEAKQASSSRNPLTRLLGRSRLKHTDRVLGTSSNVEPPKESKQQNQAAQQGQEEDSVSDLDHASVVEAALPGTERASTSKTSHTKHLIDGAKGRNSSRGLRTLS